MKSHTLAIQFEHIKQQFCLVSLIAIHDGSTISWKNCQSSYAHLQPAAPCTCKIQRNNIEWLREKLKGHFAFYRYLDQYLYFLLRVGFFGDSGS